MNRKSKSEPIGDTKDEGRKTQSDTQSLSAGSTKIQEDPTTSDMSGNSADQKISQIGFQATSNLNVDETTANAKLVVMFATKLSELVVWKKLELADGREVFALCFPTDLWVNDPKGGLIPRKVG